MIKSSLLLLLLAISLIWNFQTVSADIRSEGGVLNKKGIQWCAEEQPRYEIMGLDLFLKNNHYSLEARICANLLEDDLWTYQGSDRVEKLIERSKFYALAEIEESQLEAIEVKNDPTPTDVDPTIFALEQWRSGEISEEVLDEKLTNLGWPLERIEDLKGKKPITQEEIIEFESENISETPQVQEDKHEKQNEIIDKNSEGGGCLIATAIFGSELAPQVQSLREIRDKVVLNTNSGKSFMIGFNQFYYSFSPIISDWERENPIFKEFMKITLTPLLLSLGILNYFEIDSEAEIIGIGIGLISLNLGMYIVAPTLLVIKRKKIILLACFLGKRQNHTSNI